MLFISQASQLRSDSVNLDQQGRVVLGSHKFVIVSKRLVRNKVRSHLNEEGIHGHIYKVTKVTGVKVGVSD